MTKFLLYDCLLEDANLSRLELQKSQEEILRVNEENLKAKQELKKATSDAEKAKQDADNARTEAKKAKKEAKFHEEEANRAYDENQRLNEELEVAIRYLDEAMEDTKKSRYEAQVSISSTFYEQLFLYKIVLHSFSLLTVWLCNFFFKRILLQKAACEMLVKLTSSVNFINII